MQLLTNATATGAAFPWEGGAATFAVWGTLGGTTASLDVSFDSGTTWIASGASGSSAFVTLVRMSPCQVRCSLAGGAPVAVTAILEETSL